MALRRETLRISWSRCWALQVVMLGWIVVVLGCEKPSARTASKLPGTSLSSAPAREAVPLRVWFVAGSDSRQVIERQWQASSERPLELRILQEQELIAASRCECDVIVFPAHLIGELSSRRWLVELPAGLSNSKASSNASNSSASPSSDERRSSGGSDIDDGAEGRDPSGIDQVAGDEKLQPVAWIDQTRYGRTIWGKSVNATIPVVLTSFPLTEPNEPSPQSADARSFWKRLITTLATGTETSNASSATARPLSLDTAETNARSHDVPISVNNDPLALCDRYLVVLTSLVERETRIGLLFDPESMASRLNDEVFTEAAEIMLQIHRANHAPAALLGDAQNAWQAVAGTGLNVTIGLPPASSIEVDSVTSIYATVPPAAERRAGVRAVEGWNSGHGLVAALTSQCRQTGQASEFVRWTTSDATRTVLGKRVDGVTSEASYAPGSSAWQAQRLAQRLAQQPRLPLEPRLPGSSQYRQALGKELVRLLLGEQSAQQCMESASQAWDAITTAKAAELMAQRSSEGKLPTAPQPKSRTRESTHSTAADRGPLHKSYEQSLGL